MSDHDKLEGFLRDNAQGALVPDAESGEHLDDTLIARTVESGTGFDEAAQLHLSGCEECRTVVALALSDAERGAPVSLFERARARFGPNPLPLFVAMAAGILAVVFIPAALNQGFAPKGPGQVDLDAPSLTIRVEVDGRLHELIDGESVPMNARLSFRYGNRGARAKTVTILGWDGQNVHWYYPEGPGKAAQTLKSGPSAINMGLPFDIVFDAPHKPGSLTIAVAFDADPEQLVQALKRGAVGDRVTQYKLRLVSP